MTAALILMAVSRVIVRMSNSSMDVDCCLKWMVATFLFSIFPFGPKDVYSSRVCILFDLLTNVWLFFFVPTMTTDFKIISILMNIVSGTKASTILSETQLCRLYSSKKGLENVFSRL